MGNATTGTVINASAEVLKPQFPLVDIRQTDSLILPTHRDIFLMHT